MGRVNFVFVVGFSLVECPGVDSGSTKLLLAVAGGSWGLLAAALRGSWGLLAAPGVYLATH